MTEADRTVVMETVGIRAAMRKRGGHPGQGLARSRVVAQIPGDAAHGLLGGAFRFGSSRTRPTRWRANSRQSQSLRGPAEARRTCLTRERSIRAGRGKSRLPSEGLIIT